MSTVLTVNIPGGEFGAGYGLDSGELVIGTPARYYVSIDGDDNHFVFDINTGLFQAISAVKTVKSVWHLYRYDSNLYGFGVFDIAGSVDELFLYNATSQTFVPAVSGLGIVCDANPNGNIIWWNRGISLSAFNATTKEFKLYKTSDSTTTTFRLSGNTGVFVDYRADADGVNILDNDRLLLELNKIAGGPSKFSIYSLSAGTLTDLDDTVDVAYSWTIDFISDDRKIAYGTVVESIEGDQGESFIVQWDLVTNTATVLDFGPDYQTQGSEILSINQTGKLAQVQLYHTVEQVQHEVILDLTDLDEIGITLVSDFYTTYLPEGYAQDDITVGMGFRSSYLMNYFGATDDLIGINPLDEEIEETEPLIGIWPRSTYLRKRLMGFF